MSDLDDLAATLDPDVFDPDRKFSKQPAAVVQVAARRHMAYEGAERVLAAGWMPADRVRGLADQWEIRANAARVQGKVGDVRKDNLTLGSLVTNESCARELRAALAGPDEEASP